MKPETLLRVLGVGVLVFLGSDAQGQDGACFIRKEHADQRIQAVSKITCAVRKDPALARRVFPHVERQMALARATAAPIRMSVPSSFGITIATTFANDQVISLLERRDEFFGGPHGMSYFESLAWDVTRHRPINLPDLLVDTKENGETMTALARLTRIRLAANWRESMNVVVDDPDQKWGSTIRPRLDTFKAWTLKAGSDGKASGISIHFGPYRVAGYLDGPQTTFLPFHTIQNFIRPDYQTLFTAAE